ncbi:sorting nexin lst-4-like isoform X2 [Babylonia areolata]|uniref:sorting nexin lst-4-like isoform X2 n=1 Tax=Babylonia areolata TaxID=304850 RepID=UPI003FD32A47
MEDMIKVQCLYDFDGDTENGELSFCNGDILTVIRQDIGDGWWEARKPSGEQGLIPETYVEIMSAPEPSFPPPPPPNVPSVPLPSLPSNGYTNGPVDTGGHGHAGWGGIDPHPPHTQAQQGYDDWDEDWDDDDASSNSTLGTAAGQELQGNAGAGVQSRREGKQVSPTGETSRYGTVKSSFNRFSTFSKTGGDAFLMGVVDVSVPESDRIKIIETVEGPEWYNQDSPYTCSVASPKKETKMKGLKSFIAYQLTPTFSNIQVSRRYKHFDWLHERLESKFACMPIPPLPDKQVTGRYEEDFVQERMKLLQMWVDRMVRHPVISRSDVFLHFLTCTDEKKWKQGKRKAEKDEYQGGKFFLMLSPPQQALDMRDVDAKMEQFQKFVSYMNENVKQLNTIMHDYSKKQMGPFKREYTKIGTAFKQLAVTFNMDSTEASKQLTAAMDHTGDAFNDIGISFERQPPSDAYPLMDSLIEYRGILSVYPDVLKVHEGATGRAKECLKSQEEGKMTDGEVQKVLQRADVISYGALAEMNHFHAERVKDFKLMMQLYLRSQIKFYQDMTRKLETALGQYDKVQVPR